MSAVSKSIERRLWRNLCKAFTGMLNGISNGKALKDGKFQITKEIKAFLNSKEMNDYLNVVVGNMVHTVRKDSAKEMQEQVASAYNGALLYRLIKNEMQGELGSIIRELIQENVSFIKSMPQKWAEYAKNFVLQETQRGIRPDAIEAELRKMLPDHIKTNLKLFARTEAAKANAAIVQARAQMCGINAYIWHTVKDERTRPSHLLMEGVIVYYDDPPSPEALEGKKSYGNYHAGNTYNCRCFQEPIVDYRFLPNIVRVYHNGKIESMGKAQMEKRFGKVA